MEEGLGRRRRGRGRGFHLIVLASYVERQLRYVLLPLFEVLIFETRLPQRQALGFKQEEAIPYVSVPLFVYEH